MSDIKGDKLVLAMRADSHILTKLCVCALQLPKDTRINKYLKYVEVTKIVFDHRDDDCGNRLAKFAKAFDPGSHKCDWLAHGTYRPSYVKGSGNLSSLKILDTQHVKSGLEKTGINTEWDLFENYSDELAAYRLEGMPSVPLNTFFKAVVAWPTYENYKGKPAEFLSFCEEKFNVWKEEKLSGTGIAELGDSTVKKSLDKFKLDKKKANMARAREAATKNKKNVESAKSSSCRHLHRQKTPT